VRQLRVRRPLGFPSVCLSPPTPTFWRSLELTGVFRRYPVSSEADVSDIVGVDYLRDLGIGPEAEDGEWDGDRQEDQIEIR
jgi:hypothetical protein